MGLLHQPHQRRIRALARRAARPHVKRRARVRRAAEHRHPLRHGYRQRLTAERARVHDRLRARQGAIDRDHLPGPHHHHVPDPHLLDRYLHQALTAPELRDLRRALHQRRQLTTRPPRRDRLQRRATGEHQTDHRPGQLLTHPGADPRGIDSKRGGASDDAGAVLTHPASRTQPPTRIRSPCSDEAPTHRRRCLATVNDWLSTTGGVGAPARSGGARDLCDPPADGLTAPCRPGSAADHRVRPPTLTATSRSGGPVVSVTGCLAGPLLPDLAGSSRLARRGGPRREC